MMLAAVQMFFLASLLAAVVWLFYLARHQDAADHPAGAVPRFRNRAAPGATRRS